MWSKGIHTSAGLALVFGCILLGYELASQDSTVWGVAVQLTSDSQVTLLSTDPAADKEGVHAEPATDSNGDRVVLNAVNNNSGLAPPTSAGKEGLNSWHPYYVEQDTAYHHNGLYMGMSWKDKPAACAAECTAWKADPPCVAWTWTPSRPSQHYMLPGVCRLMSARGNDVRHEPGRVSGFLPGAQPYQVENIVAYMGYDIAILRPPDTAAQTLEQCATACTRHQGPIRCGAWTFRNATKEDSSSCRLKMFKGLNVTHDFTSGASGYLGGDQPFILQQGVGRLVSDLPKGISQQKTMADCARACHKYQGPPRCVAWAYSSPFNSTPGTCWLKAVPDRTMQTARSVVSALMPGTAPYQLSKDVSYLHDVIEVLSEPTADACATSCTMWQSRHVPCAAWAWSPDPSKQHHGTCTLVSTIRDGLTANAGSVAGSTGTAYYHVEHEVEYRTGDLSVSSQPSASDCAQKCDHHTGPPSCTAWTWHYPTLGNRTGSCRLKESRPGSTSNILRNPLAVSGTHGQPESTHKTLWHRVMASIVKPPAHKQVWGSQSDKLRLALAIVEVRQHPLLQGVLHNAAHIYGGLNDTTLHIFHGLDNQDLVHNITAGWQNVNLHNIGVRSMVVTEYSAMLTTTSFWEGFGSASHVLVFQTDAILLRPVDEVFYSEKFDYVGAPWLPSAQVVQPPWPNVGNGGLSLRRVSAMVDVCRRHGSSTEAEDVYVVQKLQPTRIPSEDLARQFCVEMVYHTSPSALHKAHDYHAVARVREWLQALAPYVPDPVLMMLR